MVFCRTHKWLLPLHTPWSMHLSGVPLCQLHPIQLKLHMLLMALSSHQLLNPVHIRRQPQLLEEPKSPLLLLCSSLQNPALQARN